MGKVCLKARVGHHQHLEEEDMTLPADTYSFWRKALEEDDHSLVYATLAEADTDEEKKRLMNGYFLQDGENNILKEVAQFLNSKGYHAVDFRRPWCLAGACGSVKVLSVLHEHGVDVQQRDDQGSNLLHLLVYLAFLDPTLERTCCNVYLHLQGLLSTDDLRKLLKSEGHHELYPLEMAAWLGTFRMFRILLETEGVYCHTQRVEGVFTVQKFDVTDYESNERRHVSPLGFLLFMDDKKVGERETEEVFKSGAICNWMEAKKRSSMLFVHMWCLIRMIYMVIFLVYDGAGGWSRPSITSSRNSTYTSSSCTRGPDLISTNVFLTMKFYLIFHSVCILLVDVTDAVLLGVTRYRKFLVKSYRIPGSWKDVNTSYSFYRCTQFQLALFVLLGTLTSLVTSYVPSDSSMTFTNLLYIFSSFSLVWSILYFTQLAPLVGYFVYTIQSMVMDNVKFSAVWIMFAFPFSMSFEKLINEGRSLETCPEEFSSLPNSLYSTFTAMVNMVNFRSYNVVDPVSLYVLHIIYVFMVAILLLNFLVALFSTSVSHVMDNKEVFTTCQWLSVLVVIDFRLGFFFHKWYDRRITKFFLHEDGKILVPVVSLKPIRKID